MKKLYVFVRSDLSPSQRAVQGAHAVAEYLLRGHKRDFLQPWNNGTIVMLRVKDASDLENTRQYLVNLGIEHAQFYEPDIKAYTAVAAVINQNEYKNFERYRLL